jgi:hypothetical protein
MILENVEVYFPRLIAGKPNAKFNKENPTWEIQGRTRDKNVKKKWEELGLRTKVMEDDQGVFYRINLKKKSRKANGDPALPVEVVDSHLKAFDPARIGNGTICNLMINSYEYGNEGQIAYRLDGVQVVHLIEYIAADREGFSVIEDCVSDSVPFDDDVEID